jgi:hypothetical protein
MDLRYVYEVLMAADEQRWGFITLHGIQADHEVRLMAQAHLVEATFNDGQEGSRTIINRVTATGRTFLRVFKNNPILLSGGGSRQSASLLLHPTGADRI